MYEVSTAGLHRALQDALYAECMILADEARHYFDQSGRLEREALTSEYRISLSCESLKITTRLMHAIAWLLTQRAVAAGELKLRDALDPSRRISDAPGTAKVVVTALPATARKLIAASIDIYERVSILDRHLGQESTVTSPALLLQQQLALALSRQGQNPL